MTEQPNWLIHCFDSVTSTMDVARYLAQFGAQDRTVVFSVEQTAGRGRSGRSWTAPAGAALFCTIILRPAVAPERLSTLPLISGVAVAEVVEAISGRDVQLKWPNDVWLGTDPNHAKVAGVLVTSSLRGNAVDYVLVGIGINVQAELSDLPEGATSILAATGISAAVDEVLDALLNRFEDVYVKFLTADGRPSLAGWRARAALLNDMVIVQEAGRSISGIFTGVDEDGGLLIQEPGRRMRKVVAGDLVRGPRLVHSRC